MTGYKLLDSSIWVDYFVNGKHKDIIEIEEKLLLATISIIEIKNKLHKLKISLKDIKEKMEFIKKQSIFVVLDENIAEKASELVISKHIPIADAIIYISALENDSELITLDNDFRGLDKVKVL